MFVHSIILCYLCQAGLIHQDNSKQLIIALEPEAAGLFCRSLEVNQLVAEARLPKELIQLPVGAKYLIVDAGGTCCKLLRSDCAKTNAD